MVMGKKNGPKSKRDTVESIGRTIGLVEHQVHNDDFTLEDIEDRIRTAMDALVEIDSGNESKESQRLFAAQVTRDAYRILYTAHKARESPETGMKRSLYAEAELDWREAKEAYVKALTTKVIDTCNEFGGNLEMKIKAIENTLKAAKGTASPLSHVVAHFVNGELQRGGGNVGGGDDEDEDDE